MAIGNLSPGNVSAAQVNHRGGWAWLRVLFFGVCLFIITNIVMLLTGNPNLYPTAILIGNFLVPVVFVTYLYGRQHLSSLPPQTIIQSFIFGGTLGVLGASVLEPLLITPAEHPHHTLTLAGALLVGLIEEGCKLIVVVLLARRLRHTRAMDGLLLGAAVGMGFAALESTGYAFTALLLSHGAVGASLLETVLRGLLAPFAHGVWTAIVSAVLFRASKPLRFRFTWSVGLAYLFVSALHGLWDGLPRILNITIPPGISVSVVTLTLSAVGIGTLILLYRQAAHQRTNDAS